MVFCPINLADDGHILHLEGQPTSFLYRARPHHNNHSIHPNNRNSLRLGNVYHGRVIVKDEGLHTPCHLLQIHLPRSWWERGDMSSKDRLMLLSKVMALDRSHCSIQGLPLSGSSIPTFVLGHENQSHQLIYYLASVEGYHNLGRRQGDWSQRYLQRRLHQYSYRKQAETDFRKLRNRG